MLSLVLSYLSGLGQKAAFLLQSFMEIILKLMSDYQVIQLL